MNQDPIKMKIMKIFDELTDTDQKKLLEFSWQLSEKHDSVLSA